MKLALAALLLAAATAPGLAQTTPPGAATPMPAAGAAPSPADQGYMQAMQKMQADMKITPTGDADRDFVAGMLPHHQGAVDMAKVELQYGKDPQMRRLAQRIVTSQQREIGQMQRWQTKHGY